LQDNHNTIIIQVFTIVLNNIGPLFVIENIKMKCLIKCCSQINHISLVFNLHTILFQKEVIWSYYN